MALRKTFEPTLNNAEDLLRLKLRTASDRSSAVRTTHRAMSPGQWLALAGLMQPTLDATLDLWEQARAQGWDVSEGCAWIVHADRGDLVRPLVERFGVDWAVEIARPRESFRGDERPVSGLSQALYRSGVTSGSLAADDTEATSIRAPSVIAAWDALGLDPTQRLPVDLALFAGVSTPVNTIIHLQLPWLGVALVCGAWETADRLMKDPRVLADRQGLSQALYAWTVSAWRYNNHAALTASGDWPSRDPHWPQRLLAAGASAHPFPWPTGDIATARMQFRKGPEATNTWAQALPHHSWLTPDDRAALDQRCASAPLWSSAQWALRESALRLATGQTPLWDLLREDTALWSTMGPDEHGHSPLQIAMAHGETSSGWVGSRSKAQDGKQGIKAVEDWQGQRTMTVLVEARPQRTQAELLGALYLGIDRDRWEMLRLFATARQTRPATVPSEGMFSDPELGHLMETIARVLYPVENTAYRATPIASQNQDPNGLVRRNNTGSGHLIAWWREEGPAFAEWLAPHQRGPWTTWCARMAEALPGMKFHYPDQKNITRPEHDQLVKAYMEQRDLYASAATDEVLRRCEDGFQSPRPAPNATRPRI